MVVKSGLAGLLNLVLLLWFDCYSSMMICCLYLLSEFYIYGVVSITILEIWSQFLKFHTVFLLACFKKK